MKGDDCFGKRVAGSETTRRGIGRIAVLGQNRKICCIRGIAIS